MKKQVWEEESGRFKAVGKIQMESDNLTLKLRQNSGLEITLPMLEGILLILAEILNACQMGEMAQIILYLFSPSGTPALLISGPVINDKD